MRLWLTVGILLGIAVIGGGAIWWMFLSSYGERQLLATQERMETQGYTLQYDKVERGGFPLGLDWVVHDVRLSHPGAGDGGMPFAGQADRVRFTSQLWSPQKMAFQVEGQHRWQIDTRGEAGIVDIAVAQAAGNVGPQAEAAGWQIETRLDDITAQPRQNAAGELKMRNAVIVAQTPLRMDGFAVDARLADIRLPQDFGLGKVVETLRLKGDVQPLPADYSKAGLTAWQVAGGNLSVTEMKLRFGPLDGGANGAMGLDGSLRPQGDLTVQVQRPSELLALAQQRGWIAEKQVPLYAMAASLFTRNNSDGEAEAVVKVGFRDGSVWLGPVRLADLPPVVTE